MDSLLSFPVGLFHPLQHAGLSRRTRSTDLPTSEIDFLAKRKMPIYDNLRTHEFGGGVGDPVE
jgi:hypothetical protein